MSKFTELEDINVFADKARQEAINRVRETVKYAREEAKRKVERAQTTRAALELLDAAGIDLDQYCYGNTYVSMSLGFFPMTSTGNRKLAAAIRRIRQALGCQVRMEGKSLGDAKKKLVTFSLTPVNFPTVDVSYSRKLPKNAKCKIVTQRSVYRSLVCEI